MPPITTHHSCFDQDGEPVGVDSPLARIDIFVEDAPGLLIMLTAYRRGQADCLFSFEFGPGVWKRNAVRRGELIAELGRALAGNPKPYFEYKERALVLSAALTACGWEQRSR